MECPRCRGDGSQLVCHSKRVLAEHRAACSVAEQAGQPAPRRPERPRRPCAPCGGSGLAPGVLAPPLESAPKVAIVGGGIGGFAAALALRQRGVNAVVYERDCEFAARAQGYGLTMQQGATALRQLGLPNAGCFSVAHYTFLPDGAVLGGYGRALHESTRALRDANLNPERCEPESREMRT